MSVSKGHRRQAGGWQLLVNATAKHQVQHKLLSAAATMQLGLCNTGAAKPGSHLVWDTSILRFHHAWALWPAGGGSSVILGVFCQVHCSAQHQAPVLGLPKVSERPVDAASEARWSHDAYTG